MDAPTYRTHASRRALVGLHLDTVLRAACKAGLTLYVFYGKAALPRARASVLAVRADDDNIVTAVC